MKFKLDARLILFFCCLCLIGVSSKKSRKGRCMKSLHSLKHKLLECHGKYVCNKSMGSKCKCIGRDSLCNGLPDCPGGEDEQNCPKKECEALPDVQYGKFRLLDPNSFEGVNATLECDEGYIAEGNPDITCQDTNGILSWTTKNGTCVLRTCPSGGLPSVLNGKYEIVGSGKVGDCAILVCSLDFCLYPESLPLKSIVCQINGMWSTPGAVGECLATRNCAIGGTITSTPADGINANNMAVDGDRRTNPGRCYVSTSVNMPFWTVNTNFAAKPIKRVEITTDGGLSSAEIEVTVGTTFCSVSSEAADRITINCDTAVMGDTVTIKRITAGMSTLTLCEVEVYTFSAKCNGLHEL